MQYHSEFNHHRRPLRDRTPWFVAEVNETPEVVDVFREYVQLRRRLVPYLVEQARVAVTTGRPLMRGLFFDHPEDSAVWEWPEQYQLGDEIIVSPVTQEGATSWSTYLPAGRWVDASSASAVDGGRVVERAVSLSEVPVYVRLKAWDRLAQVFTGRVGASDRAR
jgi:alpha-glucosidase (family GH31 glycosyl hydrolase)